MNAEALIGKVLGTCTLQKLIGQGGMGAVYLAQQSRPKRQVAVKVLLPMTTLTSRQLAAFLERFRRETDAAAALEHPNIMPVHEYGEREGLAYLVMPYVSGGTLRDLLEREGALPLDTTHSFLEQMAAAIDLAHERGVIHRDIKPANILMTPEGRVLLTDFGLVKIIAEGQSGQLRLTGPGAPVGTPDYMAPEQVIGEDVDPRADLYSLGVILYQMVTGTTPFQGDTPMQIASQHLQMPPPSPKALRPDLPSEAEHIILRAMAKRPEDRYTRAQDMANAFRMALLNAGFLIEMSTASMPRMPMSSTNGRLFVQKGNGGGVDPAQPAPALHTAERVGFDAQQEANQLNLGAGGLLRGTGMLPSVTSNQPAAKMGGGLLSRTGMMPAISKGPAPTATVANQDAGGLLSRTGRFPRVGTGQFPTVTVPDSEGIMSTVPTTPGLEEYANTGSFAATEAAQNTSGATKLTGPVKVVKVPVAGQPGRFVTGLLPVSAQDKAGEGEGVSQKKRLRPWVKVAAVVIIVLIVLGSVSAFLLSRPHAAPSHGNSQGMTAAQPANSQATAAAKATDAAQANILIHDPLDHQINGWLTAPANVFAFKNGAYHITVPDSQGRVSLLQNHIFSTPMVYSLNMQEVNGNDKAMNNTFGMVFRFSQKTVNKKAVTSFYSFEVENVPGGSYRLWKYDDSKGSGVHAWTDLWHAKFGKEFHQGHGVQAANAFKVVTKGNAFTFVVNGKTVGTKQDGSFQGGMVGLIVTLKGTEVAFNNLLITRS
ncbi:MAG TPA: serine/threonine-protein kinase [Ktedonobacteraceae bacterium]|jgi:hypothetical protein|nr:serine/threonine-protein kinase [Ktedonobacteraceae bacterium]